MKDVLDGSYMVCMYSTSSLQGVWHHIHGFLHQKCQCEVQFDQYVTTNIGVLFPYMVSLCNAVATGCNQSFYKSQQGGNSQLQSSCDQLWSSPVASPSEKLQLDFKTLEIVEFVDSLGGRYPGCGERRLSRLGGCEASETNNWYVFPRQDSG